MRRRVVRRRRRSIRAASHMQQVVSHLKKADSLFRNVMGEMAKAMKAVAAAEKAEEIERRDGDKLNFGLTDAATEFRQTLKEFTQDAARL